MKTKKRNRSVAAFLLCAFLLVCAGCGDAGHEDENVGAGDGVVNDFSDNGDNQGEDQVQERIQVPDFEMTLSDGGTLSFKECSGKKVLLNFWATWCGPCVGEMPALQKLADEFPEELVILAVNCSEDKGTVQKFIKNNGYTFPIVLDTDGAIQFIFGGITSLPTTFIIDEEGYIVAAGSGASDADSMYKVYKEALGL